MPTVFSSMEHRGGEWDFTPSCLAGRGADRAHKQSSRFSMQIFPRSTNAISRASLFVPLFVVAALFSVMAQLHRSPSITYPGARKLQPNHFTHLLNDTVPA